MEMNIGSHCVHHRTMYYYIDSCQNIELTKSETRENFGTINHQIPKIASSLHSKFTGFTVCATTVSGDDDDDDYYYAS